jgi:hypothetical protein
MKLFPRAHTLGQGEGERGKKGEVEREKRKRKAQLEQTKQENKQAKQTNFFSPKHNKFDDGITLFQIFLVIRKATTIFNTFLVHIFKSEEIECCASQTKKLPSSHSIGTLFDVRWR